MTDSNGKATEQRQTTFTVVWNEINPDAADELRDQIITAIDSCKGKLILNLSRVDGAPNRLVELLLETTRYGCAHRKTISMRGAGDELRQAIVSFDKNPIVDRSEDLPTPGVDSHAGRQARSILKSHYDSTHEGVFSKDLKPSLGGSNSRDGNKSLGRKKKSAKSKRKLTISERLVRLAALTILGSAVVVGAEWFWLTMDQDTKVIVPKKGFENSDETRQKELEKRILELEQRLKDVEGKRTAPTVGGG